MASILSIGFAVSRSWRTAQRQNEATAARFRLRVAGASPAVSARYARTGPADRPAISPSERGPGASCGCQDGGPGSLSKASERATSSVGVTVDLGVAETAGKLSTESYDAYSIAG